MVSMIFDISEALTAIPVRRTDPFVYGKHTIREYVHDYSHVAKVIKNQNNAHTK